MLQFREYAVRKMNENKYSYIIVWGENTGILFGNYLKKRYKGNYCINIRDIDIFKTLKIGKILYERIWYDTCLQWRAGSKQSV